MNRKDLDQQRTDLGLQMKLCTVFDSVTNGNRNFMTPFRYAIFQSGNLVAELSYGSGINPGTKIYGVTIAINVGGKYSLSRSGGDNQMFRGLDEAREHIISVFQTA